VLGADLSEAASAGGTADGEAASAADGVGRLYGEHADTVMAVVIALRGTRVGPEDVVQEAFARAQQHWEQVALMDRPELWVQRVALNLATSRLRRLGAEARALARLGARRQEPVTTAFVEQQGFWELVRRLPPRQAQVVALHYAGDLTVADVAETLEIAQGTVKAQLHAARRRLAEVLGVAVEREHGR
jgi:RNA polymerase sigma-70 factor, ECF subfamily